MQVLKKLKTTIQTTPFRRKSCITPVLCPSFYVSEKGIQNGLTTDLKRTYNGFEADLKRTYIGPESKKSLNMSKSVKREMLLP